MTVTGAGGVVITHWRKSRRFHKEYDKLSLDQCDLVDAKLQILRALTSGGSHSRSSRAIQLRHLPVHVTGNYKISEIDGMLSRGQSRELIGPPESTAPITL